MSQTCILFQSPFQSTVQAPLIVAIETKINVDGHGDVTCKQTVKPPTFIVNKPDSIHSLLDWIDRSHGATHRDCLRQLLTATLP